MQQSRKSTRSPLSGVPYWRDEVPEIRCKEVPLPSKTDVVVVGAGFTGLSAALTLARANREVTVCDIHDIGHGASTRNGGQIGAKLKRSLESVATQYGEDKAVAIWQTAKVAKDYLVQLIEEEGLDCDFTRSVRFQGAHRPRDYEKLCRTAERLRVALGYDLEPVPRTAQGQYVHTDAYYGGLVDRDAASFHPAKFVQALSRKAEEAGAVLSPNNGVTAIRRNATGFDIDTPNGRICASNVVIATNGYTGKELPKFRRRIIPIGSYVIATEEMPRSTIESLMPGCDLVIDTRRCASYMRVTPDRKRLLYGGRVAATDIGPVRSGPRLKEVLNHIFPELSPVGISHSWMGFTGFPLDELPKVGRQDGIHYAMGFCGSGTAMATYCGHSVAKQVLGSKGSETPLSDLEFKTSKAYGGKPWFLSTIIGMYRMLDRYGL